MYLGRCAIRNGTPCRVFESLGETDQFMAGRLQKIRDGKWSGGAVPYGYRSVNRELTIEPYEAKIVRKIFDLYMQEELLIIRFMLERSLMARALRRKSRAPEISITGSRLIIL